MIYTRFLAHMEDMLLKKYEISSTIRHRGEKGRQREHGLAMFLRENLPEAYGVATGEIIPADGELISPQCDIIIYDKLRMPIIGKYDEVQQVPIEAVYAVIEVKSILNTTALNDAREKFRRISEMPKYALASLPDDYNQNNPIFFVFGYKFATSGDACNSLVESLLPSECVVCCLDKGATIIIEEIKKSAFFSISEEGCAYNNYYVLGFFFAILIQSIYDIDLGTPDFVKLIGPFKKYKANEEK